MVKIPLRCFIGIISIILIFSCNSKTDNFGIVTSATPEATEVGKKIFLKGGNAIDVAVAVSFALGVTEPAMSGLGGGTQVLLSLKNQTPIAINGTTLSPMNTPLNVDDTLSYHRRSTIPSTVKVLDYLWKNYGSGNLTWKELIEPSIKLAKDGFIVGKYRAKVYEDYQEKLLKSSLNTSYFLIDGDKVPKEGEIIKQPVLAKTLTRLADFGADDFYKGQIAKDISEDMKKNGGWITFEDLYNFPEPKELKALSTSYKGMKVYSQPPPCGGWTTLLALNLMEQESNTSNLTNIDIVKSLHLAHEDRKNSPITDLVNYDSIVNIKLSKKYATNLSGKNSLKNAETITNNGETTHFSVVDSHGNALAVTASINAYFGSLSASKKLGFLYNTYMDDFIFQDYSHPFAIRPNAMAYSSMSPTIVQNNNENVLVIGSPGSSRIISTVSQITAKWIENNTITDLTKAPRIHASNSGIYLEKKKDTVKFDKELMSKFKLYFKIPSEKLITEEGLNPYYGGVHAIARENGFWIGVADPRRDGSAIKVQIN